MNVELTSQAETDLESIGDHIARDSPRRAISFIAEIRDQCVAIGATPKAFLIIGRYHRASIRRKVFGNYLILFRIGREAVVVLRILHGATDYEGLFGR